jgi:hypothetical protein
MSITDDTKHQRFALRWAILKESTDRGLKNNWIEGKIDIKKMEQEIMDNLDRRNIYNEFIPSVKESNMKTNPLFEYQLSKIQSL